MHLGSGASRRCRVAEGRVTFTAKVPARVAHRRRVIPGDKLDAGNFKKIDIDVTQGQAHEMRGVILAQTTDLAGLEARQTILEGQFVVSSSVQKQPDVRRGDVVRIRLISGDLTVSLQGVVQEPAYLNGQVRVLSDRTKRELMGELQVTAWSRSSCEAPLSRHGSRALHAGRALFRLREDPGQPQARPR